MSAPLVLTEKDAKPEMPCRLSPDAALVVQADGNACIVDMAGKFYGLPPVGAQMLKRTLELGEEQAALGIATQFHAAPEQVRADLRRFLADLEQRGIVENSETRRRRMGWRFLGARLFARALSLRFKLTASIAKRAKSALTVSRLSFALFGWTASLAAWKRSLPVAAPAESREAAAALLAEIDQAVRAAATRHWIGVDCKERGLSAWALARAAGLAAELNIGVKPYPLAGHCWCTSGTAIVGDSAEYAAQFTPALRYG